MGEESKKSRTVAGQAKPTDKPRGAQPAKPETQTMTIGIDGVGIDVDVATGLTGPVFFCLGVRKSGSTLLNKVVTFLAHRNGINTVDLPGTFFRKGLGAGHWGDVAFDKLIQPGNIYTGFRAMPPALADSSKFSDSLKVFMFRDPRDAVVSQYFSDAYSHSLPSEQEVHGPGREIFLKKRQAALETNIDDYALKAARALGNTLQLYEPMLNDPTCLLLRYEDYVFQKRRMVGKILRHFGWTMAHGQIEALMEKVDVVPEAEEKTRFVRKAIPGDHISKLKAETIRRINNQLKPVLQSFDYY